MAPRFDPDRLTLDLAVADLLDASLLRHIGFGKRGGYERLWLGQAIHSSYQEGALAADPSYRRELGVLHALDHRGWKVRISGRIDGLRRDADGVAVVEEIKSVRRGAQVSPNAREIYERQALIYAWMMSRSLGPVRAELVLIQIGEVGDGAIRREPLDTDLDAIELGIRRRLNSLLRAFEGEKSAGFRRKSAAARLRFPYGAMRTGQEAIVAAVNGALERGEHLLLQAATGIGKTVAALYPAVRYALANDKRVFVLTAKTLQQEMAMTVLRLLNRDADFSALRLRAKAKMCANDEVICHEEYCRFAKDYFLKLETSGLVRRLRAEQPNLDPDAIFSAAKATDVCPFEVSLDLATRAEVVVCDYNYAFDPYVALAEFAPDGDLSNVILVIDEAHNLVERGRGYYSPELSAQTARTAAEAVGRGGEPVHRVAERLCLALASAIEAAVADALEEEAPGAIAVETVLPEEALWRLRPEFDAAFVDYLEHQRESKSMSADDRFVALYFGLLRFLNVLLLADAAFSRYVVAENGDRKIRMLCKDPSRFLGAILSRTHAAIGLSATLSPPDFYRDLLGFGGERTTFLALPDPFPPAHRRVVVDSTVATTFRERPANTPRIAERLAAFTDAVPGNCLALFPSYQFLEAVAAQLRPRHKRILIQQRADNDRAREAILETLRSALLGDVLLLAVAGGVFAEGVDYPGDMLQAVAVVGPCLPAATLELELLKRYYEERFERGFEYAFVVPGMTRVVQAAGRLIRSPQDRGVIALFDRRFLRPPYRDHLPPGWLPEGTAERGGSVRGLAGDPGLVALEFFA
jgi:DNA excision repair protein ERCC-2